jgi:acetyl esterase/lipase
VNIDGPGDPGTFQPSETQVCSIPAVTNLLGGTPAQHPERYRDSSAMSFLPLGIPQEFIAGGLLNSLPNQVRTYQSEARAKGEAVTVTSLPGAGHFDMLLPASQHWRVLEDRLLAAIRALK